jgi:hypothetical protein
MSVDPERALVSDSGGARNAFDLQTDSDRAIAMNGVLGAADRLEKARNIKASSAISSTITSRAH